MPLCTNMFMHIYIENSGVGVKVWIRLTYIHVLYPLFLLCWLFSPFEQFGTGLKGKEKRRWRFKILYHWISNYTLTFVPINVFIYFHLHHFFTFYYPLLAHSQYLNMCTQPLNGTFSFRITLGTCSKWPQCFWNCKLNTTTE